MDKTKKNTQKELREKDIKPIKHRGQNFLVSEEIIARIILEAKIVSDENILEVGPGTGNLTEALLEKGAEVIAVEKDKNLIELLESKIRNTKSETNSKLQIINQDILSFNEDSITSPYRVIANIPYYLTGKLIQKFLLSPNKPSELILMVQKEVGERITAQPPRANYLSSLVQFMAETEILFKVGKENFWPQPKVDSVIIKLTPHLVSTSLRSYAHAKSVDRDEFIRFLKVVFKQPRQTLFNNLRKSGLLKSEALEKLFLEEDFPKNIRPQNLDLEKLKKLFQTIMVY